MSGQKKIVAIVLYPGLTALDAIGPYEILKDLPDCELRFVWREKGVLSADSGVLKLQATHSFEETPDPFLFLVPGSEPNTLTAMQDPALLAWVAQAHETSSYTASVCTGSCILAAAGVLKGHPATTHWAAMDILQGLGAQPQPDKRIVQSGKIWTAAGVSAGVDLGLALFGAIAGRDQAEVAQLMIEYDPEPPFNSGHMSKARPEIAQHAIAEMTTRASGPRPAIAEETARWRERIEAEAPAAG